MMAALEVCSDTEEEEELVSILYDGEEFAVPRELLEDVSEWQGGIGRVLRWALIGIQVHTHHLYLRPSTPGGCLGGGVLWGGVRVHVAGGADGGRQGEADSAAASRDATGERGTCGVRAATPVCGLCHTLLRFLSLSMAGVYWKERM